MKEQERQEIINTITQGNYSTANNNSSKTIELNEDVKSLIYNITDYFTQHYPNVQYKTFFDKPFLDTMKFIIKNEEVFKDFLKYTNYEGDLRDFVSTAIYICPQVFTTAINKIIREYLTSDIFQNSDN